MPMQTSRKHVKILPALITNIFGDLRARQSYKHIFVSLVQGISAQGIRIFPTLPIFPKNVYAANGDFYKIIFVKLLASRREVWIVPITWGTHKPKQNAPKTPQQNTTQPPKFVVRGHPTQQPYTWTKLQHLPRKTPGIFYKNIFVGSLLGICFHVCRFLLRNL